MQREISVGFPYTGKPNPTMEANYGGLETYYITEEKLSDGNGRFYPTMSVSLDGDRSWNIEHLLKKWHPEYCVDYCDSYEMAESVIKKNKEFRSDLFFDVVVAIQLFLLNYLLWHSLLP